MSSKSNKTSVLVQLGFGLRPIPSFIHLDHNEAKHVRTKADQALPLADSSVDSVLIGHDVWKLEQDSLLVLFRECRRVIRPGGYIRLNMVESGVDEPALSGDLRSRDPETLEDLIRLAGLIPIGMLSVQDSCLHQLRHQELDDIYRQGFEACKEQPPSYSSSEAPLVSVLIPAYNPRFFQASFESALKQTYPRIEIIISDDSPTEKIKTMVESATSDKQRIRYIRNEIPLGRYGNYQRCFDLATGPYIKYLNDDDYLHPDCVLRMARCLRRYPEATLVTSHRQIIDDRGNPLTDIPATYRVASDETMMNGITVTNAILSQRLNFVGEPTTTMFRKGDLYPCHPSINSIAGIQIEYINDIAMWLNLLGKGNLIYLGQTLSYFRMHSEQGQAEPDAEARSQTDWHNILTQGQRLGYWHPKWPVRLEMHPLEMRSQWPDRIFTIIEQASDHLGKKQIDKAIQALVEASKISSDDPWILVTLGDLSLRAGDAAVAEQRYIEAIKYSPEYLPAYMSRGILALKQDKLDEAESMFRKASQLQPSNLRPLKLLGRAYLKNERFDEGVKLFVDIVKQRPQDMKSLYALGLCYLGAGNHRAAETAFRKLLNIDPANRLAKENLKLIDETLNRS